MAATATSVGGGREIQLPEYQVLISRIALNWRPASYGRIPINAIAGGYENGMPLYICQARYRDGLHVGKVVGQACNFGWGGREIALARYQVLTM